MSLFDSLESVVTGLVSGGNQAGGSQGGSLVQEALSLVQNHPGGLSGLVQQFEGQGLGATVQSWVGTGQNLPVSGDQIQQVLGSDMVQQLAGKLGVDPSHVAAQLSQFLPQIIDKLTPTGQAPQGSGGLLGEGLDLLKGKLLG